MLAQRKLQANDGRVHALVCGRMESKFLLVIGESLSRLPIAETKIAVRVPVIFLIRAKLACLFQQVLRVTEVTLLNVVICLFDQLRGRSRWRFRRLRSCCRGGIGLLSRPRQDLPPRIVPNQLDVHLAAKVRVVGPFLVDFQIGARDFSFQYFNAALGIDGPLLDAVSLVIRDIRAFVMRGFRKDGSPAVGNLDGRVRRFDARSAQIQILDQGVSVTIARQRDRGELRDDLVVVPVASLDALVVEAHFKWFDRVFGTRDISVRGCTRVPQSLGDLLDQLVILRGRSLMKGAAQNQFRVSTNHQRKSRMGDPLLIKRAHCIHRFESGKRRINRSARNIRCSSGAGRYDQSLLVAGYGDQRAIRRNLSGAVQPHRLARNSQVRNQVIERRG